MVNCCDDLSYAKYMKVVTEGNLGPAMKVRDPDEPHSFSYIPLKFCPWCARELDRGRNTVPPVVLHSHP